MKSTDFFVWQTAKPGIRATCRPPASRPGLQAGAHRAGTHVVNIFAYSRRVQRSQTEKDWISFVTL
jgi:hypothetical protein